MTVSSETNRIRYDGNDSTTVFPVPMRFLQNADIVAYLIDSDGDSTLQVESSDYTLTGAGDASGGTLTMTTAPASTEELLIIRDPAVLQPLDLVAGEPLPAEEVEKAFDRTVYEVQRSRDLLGKTIRVPDTVEGSDFEFPEGVTRAGKFMGFTAGGKPTFLTGTGNDADLRTDLASTDLGKGSDLVGNAAKVVNVLDHGIVGDGTTDNTAAFTAMVTAIDEGSYVLFPFTTQGYKGNFISTKSLTLDFQGSTLVENDVDESTIEFEGTVDQSLTTLTADTAFGDATFAVTSADDIAAGDLVFLRDGKTRPGDGSTGINTELLLVKGVASLTITPYDMIRSIQDTGTRTVGKVTAPIVGPVVKNLKIATGGVQTQPTIYFYGCMSPRVYNLETTNTLTAACRFDYCYDPKTFDVRVFDPQGTASGEGYGVEFLYCRKALAFITQGRGTRHIVDFNSSYDCDAEYWSESDGKGDPVVPAHNTFGGRIGIRHGVFTCDDFPAIVLSAQGVSTGHSYVFRDLSIDDISHFLPTAAPTAAIHTVFIQTSYSNLHIDRIRQRFNDNATVPNDNSNIVRLNGVPVDGASTINDLESNRVGTAVQVLVGSAGAPASTAQLVLNHLRVQTCKYLANLRGIKNVVLSDLSATTVGTSLVNVDKSGDFNPEYIDIEGARGDATKPLLTIGGSYAPSTRLLGSFNPGQAGSAVVDVTAGGTLTETQLQHNANFIYLQTPSSATVTLSATAPFPKATHIGQRFTVYVEGGRGDIVIPAAATNMTIGSRAFTMKKGNTYEFVAQLTGNWMPVRDNNILYGSATYDPPSLVDGAGATTTVTVTGAALGDFAEASFSLDLQGITTTAWVSAADTVSVRLQNETTGTIDLSSGTLAVRVIRK